MEHINEIVLFSHKEWDYGGGAGETVSRLSVCLHLWRSELDLPGLRRKLGPMVHVSNPSAPTVRWENTGESPKATGTREETMTPNKEGKDWQWRLFSDFHTPACTHIYTTNIATAHTHTNGILSFAWKWYNWRSLCKVKKDLTKQEKYCCFHSYVDPSFYRWKHLHL